jgi:chaperonin GroEL
MQTINVAGERKTSYLEDIAILTGGTMVKEELGVTLDKADESVLGVAAKVVISKEACTIVGDGRTQGDVDTRVKQIRNLAEQTEQEYEKEKLNERIARLSGGVAIIQVRFIWRCVLGCGLFTCCCVVVHVP